VRQASFASKHSGRAPPWRTRDVDLVLSLDVARAIHDRARLHAQDGGRFTIRQYGTIVVWSEGGPIGSFTLVRNRPVGAATVRRIAWDERCPHAEHDVWSALEHLAGEPLALSR
jgi:hypothetical protein